MTFAEQLRKAREASDLTLDQAAQLCGVSRRTWCYWEDGDREPATEADAITQERLLKALTDAATPLNHFLPRFPSAQTQKT